MVEAWEIYPQMILIQFNDEAMCPFNANGTKEWFQSRDGDAPAVVRANGVQEWWVEGHRRGSFKP